jgi:prevent-host-death family protein
MKTASVREVQHGLADILEEVRRGQVVRVTHRGEVVAEISPASERRGPVRWPDSMARMRRRFGLDPIAGAPASLLIDESRGERA